MNKLDDIKNFKLGLYVHIPFCKKRCIYCDFVSYVENNFDEYTEYLLKEIDLYKEYLNSGIDTLYIGGGTPSIFPIKNISKIFEKLEPYISNNAEITIEVNPESFTKENAQFYKKIGVNRISMGLQSADDVVLKKSGRLYDFETFIRKFDIAKRYFDNINVDFIIGLPGESWSTIGKNVQFISDFLPDHISVYMLEVHNDKNNSVLKKPDDQTFQRYDDFLNAISGFGYERYEISNFALNGKYCKHNLKYWANTDYVGLGISAGGHIGFLRYNNHESFSDYFISISEGKFPRAYESLNTPEREALETTFMNLRTMLGVDKEYIKEKTNIDISPVMDALKNKFDFFDGKKLSEKGMDFSNLFFVTLLSFWEEYFR
ncbi:radical SAM family heme chaperone HemW [Fervidobacterium sp. 2310opik-2]|uniref:radical SAM family heme chaperone HemW n=1 Tax=Fervidobacterium sp. 2310opik-2 TaxID=1755815 RepID=UPI00169C7265|nr:radical SAM family heme chaperone HemW [Fervidobacterium sp. 2310opik-2]KAF2962400.1 coproporphyrinogen III oxidase [Fervidobacterium sp. 2310opik-2]